MAEIENDKEDGAGVSGKDAFWANLGEGIGCLAMLIGAVLVIWALKGFPGLVH